MLNITEITDLKQVYDYQMRWSAPNFFPTDFESWKNSFAHDTDGEGRPLFRQLGGKAAYDADILVGFLQYGMTAFGFDDCGELSADVSYPVIRSLYFDEGREDAGRLLLREATEQFKAFDRVYAFFHYFGMGCFARHGKLFERYRWIEELLYEQGFVTEHENVYYSALLQELPVSEVEIIAHEPTKGSHRSLNFVLEGQQVGGCEVHSPVTEGIAYLRWIYVNEEVQNRGVGTLCMNALKAWLWDRGITRLDTDTALSNLQAQRYYEKNAFAREGITRSYYLTK